LVLRRAYRVLLDDDAGPLRHRLTREAKRLLVAAAIVSLLIVALAVAVVVALVVYLT
jgi:hypothetical protein